MEKNLAIIARHVLSLVTQPKTISTHIDAVYSRRCVSFILRSVFGKLLGESAQFVAARHLCQLICPETSQAMKREDAEGQAEGAASAEREKDKERDKMAVLQHMLICSILEIGALVFSLNTAALPLLVGDGGVIVPHDSRKKQPPLLEAVTSVLVYPMPAARLAGAWCMHCIGLALPSQLSILVDYCLRQLKKNIGSPDAVSGYSYATAALLATVRYSELGIPSAKAKV